jgi:FkbM family methyltransferase
MFTRLRRWILIPLVEIIAPSKNETALTRFIGRENLSSVALFRNDGWNEVLYRGLSLSDQDVVCIFGAYLGDSIYEFRNRYQTQVIGLEPISEFCKTLEVRFINDSHVRILPIGVSDRTESVEIDISDDGTSIYKKGTKSETINCIDIVELLDSFEQMPTLLEINIEGLEFRVLDRLLNSYHASSINSLIIQFHNFVVDSELSRAQIRKLLSKDYDEVYCYPFVWERWDLKK